MDKVTYGFDKSGNVPFIAIHTFRSNSRGELEHLIDGNLRATVPPEGWEDYCREYPDAQSVVDSMTFKPQQPDPVTITPLDDGKENADTSASPVAPDQPTQ